MKNLIFTFILILSFNSYSQDCEIFNIATFNLDFQLATRPLNPSLTHPVLDSGLTLYTLTPAMATVLYTNPPGIPYDSPGSVPYINTWRRQVIPSGAYTNTPNALAMSIFTNSQKWDYVKWNVPGLSGFSGTGYYSIGQSVSTPNSGAGTTVYFDCFNNGGPFLIVLQEY